jgi:hypothetical protein
MKEQMKKQFWRNSVFILGEIIRNAIQILGIEALGIVDEKLGYRFGNYVNIC